MRVLLDLIGTRVMLLYIHMHLNFSIHMHKSNVTLIFPFLIWVSVPTSKTGVFPYKFLSSRGPSFGRRSPNWAVSPSMRCDIRSKNWSTKRIGNHLSKNMDKPKVDFPSICCGKICTCKMKRKRKDLNITLKIKKWGGKVIA